MNGTYSYMWNGFNGFWDGAGQAVSRIGDVNGDGLNDIIFSSYESGFDTRNGRVDIFGGDTSLHIMTSVNNNNGNPSTTNLKQNYPNPFNPTTKIKYNLPENNFVSLKVYDVLGREVATLVNSEQEAGYKSIQFDASKLSSGMYFYKLVAGSFVDVKKMVVVK